MKRDEMDAASDLLSLEQLDEFISSDAEAIQIELNHVEMPAC